MNSGWATKFKRRFWTLGILVFAFSIGTIQFATAVPLCYQAHNPWAKLLASVSPEQRDTLLFLNHFLQTKSLSAMAEKLYSNSQQFRDYYHRQTGHSNFDFSQITAQLLIGYHQHFFRQFQEPVSMSQLTSESIHRSLKAHGYQTNQRLSGRKNLEILSQENLNRYLDLKQIRQIHLQHPEIEKVVQNVKISFRRNTAYKTIHSGLIISSKMMEKYGIGAGKNTQFELNRKVLQTDDNIFFFVDWAIQGQQKAQASEFGNASFSLREDVASQNGFISAYVMWPDHIVRFAKNHLGYESSRVLNEMNSQNLPKSLKDWKPEWVETAFQVASELYRMDFTVADYQILYRGELSKLLLEQKEKGTPAEYESLISSLLKDGQAANQSFRSIVQTSNSMLDLFGPFGFVEFKIPVAIKANELSEIDSQ